MSLNTSSMAFVGPGFVTREVQKERWIEVQYVRSGDGNCIASGQFNEWLAQQNFSVAKTDAWNHETAMGVSVVDDGGSVAGLNVSFDCTSPGRLDDWLSLCRALIDFGFRVTGEETANVEEIRSMIQASLAWELNHSVGR